MLCKKVVVSLVMTFAVSAQVANAEIAARTSTNNDYADMSTVAFTDGHNGIRTAVSSALPLNADVRSELWLRDIGVRSLANSYWHGPSGGESTDTWLMVLVAGGLVVLQLRRKQKSLPQRPVIESENKLFWG
jgi:hypothetical protein